MNVPVCEFPECAAVSVGVVVFFDAKGEEVHKAVCGRHMDIVAVKRLAPIEWVVKETPS